MADAAGPLTIAAAAIAASAKAAANPVAAPTTTAASGNTPTVTAAVEDAANEIAATNFAVAKAIQTTPAAPAKLAAEGGGQPPVDPQLLSIITPANARSAKTADKTLTATLPDAATAPLGSAGTQGGPMAAGTPPQPQSGPPGASDGAGAAHSAGEQGGQHAASRQSDVKGANLAPGSNSQPASPGQNHDSGVPPTQPQFDPTAQMANVIQQPQPQSPPVTAIPAAQMSAAVAAGLAVPMNGLAVQIAANAQGGRSRFEIRLDPAELGRIDVRLDVDRHGQVTSHLIVEKPETLSMLRQDAPQLQRALEDAGLKTDNNGLQFSLRDQSSSGNNGNSDNGSRRNSHRLIVGDVDAISASAGNSISYSQFGGASRGLDIRV